VTGTQVNLARLGTVPRAASAGHATSADSATNAGHATSADSATNAGHATSADSATNAGHATSADSATNADHAKLADAAQTALVASNAQSFNGDPPSSFLGRTLTVTAWTPAVSAGNLTEAEAMCPNGYEAVGGGILNTAGDGTESVVSSAPLIPNAPYSPGQYGAASGWEGEVYVGAGTERAMVSVICAKIGP
jgi:hypothetical protein